MEENEIMQENNTEIVAETAPNEEVETTETTEEKPVEVESEPIKSFTQEELNNIVRERLTRQENKILKMLGLESVDSIDEFVKTAKENEKYKLENSVLKKELAFKNNGVDESRIDDIETWFKGKDLELTTETLSEHIKNHPEWVANKPTPTTTIKTFTPEKNAPKEVDGWENAKKLFFGHR